MDKINFLFECVKALNQMHAISEKMDMPKVTDTLDCCKKIVAVEFKTYLCDYVDGMPESETDDQSEV